MIGVPLGERHYPRTRRGLPGVPRRTRCRGRPVAQARIDRRPGAALTTVGATGRPYSRRAVSAAQCPAASQPPMRPDVRRPGARIRRPRHSPPVGRPAGRPYSRRAVSATQCPAASQPPVRRDRPPAWRPALATVGRPAGRPYSRRAVSAAMPRRLTTPNAPGCPPRTPRSAPSRSRPPSRDDGAAPTRARRGRRPGSCGW